jgi:hypothetical protein
VNSTWSFLKERSQIDNLATTQDQEKCFHWIQACKRAAGMAGVFLLLLRPLPLQAQSNPSADANPHKADAMLAETIAALGGQAWLKVRSIRGTAHVARFFQGQPQGDTESVETITAFPGRRRVNSRKGKVVQIFRGNQGWEITYRGARPLSQSAMDEYLRWREHGLRTVLTKWLGVPGTLVLDGGTVQVERQLTEKITIMNAGNDVVVLQVDANTHLPRSLGFRWRDPRFHDQTTSVIEYANYHRIGGVETPLTVTYLENGQPIRTVYIESIEYNVAVPSETFDPDTVAAHLR